MTMTRRKTYIAPTGELMQPVSAPKLTALERRVEELMQALSTQWEAGYEACEHDHQVTEALLAKGLDPSAAPRTRNPW